MNIPLISRIYLDEVMEPTWPPAAYESLGPFRLRQAQGGGKRVNATTLEGKWQPSDIAALEARIAQPLFAIRAGDEALDAYLQARGYQIVDPVVIYRAPVTSFTAAPEVIAHWPPLARAKEIWADYDIGAGRLAVMERVKSPKAVMIARQQERIAGLGFCALSGDQAMIHALLSCDFARRQGIGSQILQSAANWAAHQGAKELSLAVTAQNTAACALYNKLNMEIIGQYHYRLRP